MPEAILRPVHWVGSSRGDLRTFPDEVQDRVGFALYQAQIGGKHRDAKPLVGFGRGVLEIVVRSETGAYRAVYAVRFREALYVLHVFHKKSKRGIATPKSEIDLVKRRLRAAEMDYRMTYAKGEPR